jgi:peptidoglycan/xylan/chitin deacetylase (PgdA/CDA1 family)
VITFDDGYADNLHHAKPLLEHYEIPATVFVTGGHVGSQREFWWDELDRLLLQPGSLPRKLRLGSNEYWREWDLGESAIYSNSDYLRDKYWHVEREEIPTARQRLFQDLHTWIQPATEEDRQSILRELAIQAGVEPTGRASHRALTAEELNLLEAQGLIEVGAHTMTHPLLAGLPVDEQKHQILASKEILEKISNRPVTSFAFPHGSYTKETITILREAGFLCASNTNANAVWQNTSQFELPRLGVRDWDRDAFAHWLRWWMDG